MNRAIVCLTVVFVFVACASAPRIQSAPAAVAARVQALADEFGSDGVGIAVIDLRDEWGVNVNGDTPMPQQSVFKTWIAVAVASEIEAGRLSWDDTVTVGPDDLHFNHRPIVDIIGASGGDVSILQLVRAMVIQSDNPSADVLLRKLGGPHVVQGLLTHHGITNVKVTVGESGLGDNAEATENAVRDSDDTTALTTIRARLHDDPNAASARGIADGLAKLYRGELLGPVQTQKLLAMLQETSTGPNRIKAGAAAGWTVMHKTGGGGATGGISLGLNDSGIVVAPDGRALVVVVLTAGTRRTTAEAEQLIADVTRVITAP